MMEDDDTDWLEGGEPESESESVPSTTKGELVTKSALAKVLGYAIATIDKMVGEGLPVVDRGSRRLGWKINTAAAHSWIVRRAVGMATGNEDVAKFDSAKARDKDAQARIREYRLAQEMKITILRTEAAAIYSEQVGEFRKRLFEGPDAIPDLTDEQRAAMLTWIDLCLSEFSGLPSEGEG